MNNVFEANQKHLEKHDYKKAIERPKSAYPAPSV